MGEAFCFRFTSELSGTAFAFQHAKGVWYLLPLRHDGLVTEVERSTQTLPRDGDTALPLSEDSNPGFYRFVMIIAANEVIDMIAKPLSVGLAIVPDQLRDVIDALIEDSAFAVHRVDAMIM